LNVAERGKGKKGLSRETARGAGDKKKPIKIEDHGLFQKMEAMTCASSSRERKASANVASEGIKNSKKRSGKGKGSPEFQRQSWNGSATIIGDEQVGGSRKT